MSTCAVIEASIPEFLKDHIVIQLANQPGMCYLGPMGDTDPIDFINLETHRVPVKQGIFDPNRRSGTFSSWPTLEPGWRDWYHRVAKTYSGLNILVLF
ncbi:hypothetical protein PVAP13_1NG215809 [Panicum virgatum]|uniref:Uncharacterized protein n=1 Tax=Panicum virgatum TaxID=38727 RepID=A0A8T0WMX1_PANVG|nr:hypothetical protein PVAP13_1NG215809 [Panicum virgatum]